MGRKEGKQGRQAGSEGSEDSPSSLPFVLYLKAYHVHGSEGSEAGSEEVFRWICPFTFTGATAVLGLGSAGLACLLSCHLLD